MLFFFSFIVWLSGYILPLILVPPSSYHCTALSLPFFFFFWSFSAVSCIRLKKKGILSTDLFSQSFPPPAFSCYPIRIPKCLWQNTAQNTFSCPGPLTSRQTETHTHACAHKRKRGRDQNTRSVNSAMKKKSIKKKL